MTVRKIIIQPAPLFGRLLNASNKIKIKNKSV